MPPRFIALHSVADPPEFRIPGPRSMISDMDKPGRCRRSVKDSPWGPDGTGDAELAQAILSLEWPVSSQTIRAGFTESLAPSHLSRGMSPKKKQEKIQDV